MRVLINRLPVDGPYGGGNLFVQAAYKYLPEFGYQPVLSLAEKPEVVLMIGPHPEGMGIGINELIAYKRERGWKTQIVHRINENDARKGTTGVDDLLARCQRFVDERVFVSNWLRDHLLERWQGHRHSVYGGSSNPVIYNGVDRELFKPREKLQNGKVNIVAHHWSDNRLKGGDVYEYIDQLVGEFPERLAFTYIGRHKCDFQHTRVIAPLFGEALAAELGQHDVYVSASRFDPGPNHITESISCELPTYVHHDGGGSVEFAGADHVYHGWDELRTILLSGEFQRNTTRFADWRECIRQYAKLFDELTRHML